MTPDDPQRDDEKPAASAESSGLSSATVTSPGIGLGSEPAAAAAAAQPATPTPTPTPSPSPSSGSTSPGSATASDDPFENLPFGDRPELQAGAAFAATFLFAKVLKLLGS